VSSQPTSTDPIIISILGPEVVPKTRASRQAKNGQGSDFIGLVEWKNLSIILKCFVSGLHWYRAIGDFTRGHRSSSLD